MGKSKNNNSKGFTLIEVVLVLAIGGLIFLLAFIAFQQVSTNRRDTQRRSDAGRMIAELQNYYTDKKQYPWLGSNHSENGTNQGICAPGVLAGGILADFNIFSTSYLCKNGEFKSPSGMNYTTTTNAGTLTKDQVRYSVKNVLVPTPLTLCDGTTTSLDGSYKIEIGLEKGSVICRDSK